ncbi:MAG TPA: hypothetical protein VGY98_03570 [Verrucomicrobiae bacterium]|nr:hypothetical protein [Verrucomicrobiae bacterium]
MTRNQKTILVTAAIAGLVAGAVVKAKTVSNDQIKIMAGKPVLSNTTSLNGCPSCGGKTNSVSKN